MNPCERKSHDELSEVLLNPVGNPPARPGKAQREGERECENYRFRSGRATAMRQRGNQREVSMAELLYRRMGLQVGMFLVSVLSAIAAVI